MVRDYEKEIIPTKNTDTLQRYVDNGQRNETRNNFQNQQPFYGQQNSSSEAINVIAGNAYIQLGFLGLVLAFTCLMTWRYITGKEKEVVETKAQKADQLKKHEELVEKIVCKYEGMIQKQHEGFIKNREDLFKLNTDSTIAINRLYESMDNLTAILKKN
jgi:hypothetical protein